MSDSVAKSASSPSKRRVFFQRLTSTVILWTVTTSALFAPSETLRLGAFLLVMMVLGLVTAWEISGLVEGAGDSCHRALALLFTALLIGGGFVLFTQVPNGGGMVAEFELFGLIVAFLVLLTESVRRFNGPASRIVGPTLLVILYSGVMINFLQRIYFFEQGKGAFYLLFFIVATKFSDAGAYAVGSLLGRHKMCPQVSPGKTWEGFVGAIVASTLLGVGIWSLGSDQMPGFSLDDAIVVSGLLGASAVLGDLVESVIKRKAGAKDSGRFFPGIGGMYDLMDSLLFNAPIMYFYLRYVIAN